MSASNEKVSEVKDSDSNLTLAPSAPVYFHQADIECQSSFILLWLSVLCDRFWWQLLCKAVYQLNFWRQAQHSVQAPQIQNDIFMKG